ncbi:MAG: hypothetical protein JWM44_1710 [Bacilli bacterium]|nr:hypothetical protein [Bacilli bacterium]
MVKFAVGIDIGGTKTAIGIVDEKGTIAAQQTIHTDLTKTPEQMVQIIAEVVKLLQQQNEISDKDILGIGIGGPGPLDTASGKFTCPPNLPSWSNFKVVEQFAQFFKCPIQLQNDATAAALAEKWLGAAQENRNFIYMTISTGIGAGLFLNGALFAGSYGNAGDVGHIVIDPAMGTCKCGQNGCFEWVASGTAIARLATERLGRETSTKEVFAGYDRRDPQMVALVEQVFEYIGMGVVSLINTFDPEKFVIGGGVSQVGEPLFTAVRSYVKTYALSPAGRETQIVPALLNQNAGFIGAAALIVLNS